MISLVTRHLAVSIDGANVCVSLPAPFVPLNVATPKTHKANQSFRIEPSPGQGRLSHRDPKREYAVLASRTLWPYRDDAPCPARRDTRPGDDTTTRANPFRFKIVFVTARAWFLGVITGYYF